METLKKLITFRVTIYIMGNIHMVRGYIMVTIYIMVKVSNRFRVWLTLNLILIT